MKPETSPARFTGGIILPLLALALLLASCGPSADSASLTQERLHALNCQPEDFPRDQVYSPIAGRPPDPTVFLGTPVLLSSNVAYNASETRQSFDCTLFVFTDEDSVRRAYEIACDELTPPFSFPNIGDHACQGGQREVTLIFRKGALLGWIWADFNGVFIRDLARKLADRLPDS